MKLVIANSTFFWPASKKHSFKIEVKIFTQNSLFIGTFEVTMLTKALLFIGTNELMEAEILEKVMSALEGAKPVRQNPKVDPPTHLQRKVKSFKPTPIVNEKPALTLSPKFHHQWDLWL